jgi:hypothetical protein
MASLTILQIEALFAIVEDGKVYPYLEPKTIPSLLKRGLITKKFVSVPRPPDYFCTMTGMPKYRSKNTKNTMFKTIKYGLTPEGRDEYIKICTKRYQAKREELDRKYEANIARAKFLAEENKE